MYSFLSRLIMSFSNPPQEGDLAPTFSGTIQDGTVISSADFIGKKFAIYFYPRDNTPVCTTQACNLRDHFEDLSSVGISIIGVSDDPVDKHVNFAGKHRLPFPLIADVDQVMLKAYGVYGEKSMFGRKYMGTKRVTYLIDEAGIIQKVINKPKTSDHATEIRNGFRL